MGKKLSISRRILAARINPPHGSTSEAIHIFMGRDSGNLVGAVREPPQRL
jgi:hypothetical protein